MSMTLEMPKLPTFTEILSRKGKGPPDDYEGLILLIVVTVLIILPYIIFLICR